ncbi:MAG TPA: hypothetical protein VHP11_11205 [Tepidisphaeraceae bacterium]|nr:hypothetical protein [Tepidisphaeraceae bacterium]
MRNHWLIAGASVALILLSTGLGYASQGEIGFVPSRPPHSQALDTAMPPDSLYLFRDCDFRGDTTRLAGITQTPVGAAQDLGKVHGVSAARWSLPPGVVVVLYDKPGGRGRQIPLWGKGQIDALSRWDFNDKASSWAWYYVGAPAPGQRPQQILPPRPAGAGPTDAILPEALEFYQDHDLRIPSHKSSSPIGH